MLQLALVSASVGAAAFFGAKELADAPVCRV
jgi:hypothetical protein